MPDMRGYYFNLLDDAASGAVKPTLERLMAEGFPVRGKGSQNNQARSNASPINSLDSRPATSLANNARKVVGSSNTNQSSRPAAAATNNKATSSRQADASSNDNAVSKKSRKSWLARNAEQLKRSKDVN